MVVRVDEEGGGLGGGVEGLVERGSLGGGGG